MLIIFSLFITTCCFYFLWAEHLWDGFFRWGPPFQVGSILIQDWTKWCVFVGLLICYQITNVYMEETVGRKIERHHIEQKKWSDIDVLELCCYNLYRWLGTILHILVAVTRLDIWLAIAVVDTLTRACIWYDRKGRAPRVFKL